MKHFLLFILLIVSIFAFSQKKISAVKVNHAPKIDGILNDEAWANVPVADNFISYQPKFGDTSSYKTEVKLVYTNEAIFIAAYLFDDPQNVRKQLTARDAEKMQDVDFFSVVIDTYNDKQNAFQFGVTSINVQSDARVSTTQAGTNFDISWDAVWYSHTNITNNGWIVEMKIPYMSLRFAKKDVQKWGINFFRLARKQNESSYWNAVNPNNQGLLNQFGEVDNLQQLNPPLRLSFMPYLSTGYSTVPTNNGTINTFLKNGGMDVKYGINESFTMDMTLIPDFGQTVSDNIVLNLSAFEQQFKENRPFFTEGTELFNKANMFYSRRIGKTPAGYYAAKKIATDSNYQIIKNPTTTQLYNATKFSGRTKQNLGIGIFNAITAPTFAEFENSKKEKIKYETEPLANYNIIVLDKALKNRSSLTLTNTNVIRNGNARDANVTGVDVLLFDKKSSHKLQMLGRYSTIKNSTNYNGYKTYAEYGKISGNWQWSLWNNIESEKYDPNDLGILKSPNEHSFGTIITYQQFTPNKHFNYRNYRVSIEQINYLKPYQIQTTNIHSSFLHLFKNFWDIRFEFSGVPFWGYDNFDLRTTGRTLKKAPYAFGGIFGSSDSRKKLFISYGFGFAESPLPKDPFYLISLGARYRFNDKLKVEVNRSAEIDEANFGFTTIDASGEPVIGRRKIKNYNTVLNAEYNFKARMNLSVRARHFWSNVIYTNLYHVALDGEWRNSEITYTNIYDANFNAFNIDAFYTWDFKPGCRFMVAWKNALGPDVYLSGLTNSKYTQNFSNVFTNPHSNEVSVKFTYFIDYNSISKRNK